MWKTFKSLIWLRDFESNCFPGPANIWLSIENFRMFLLVFVEPLPLLINEQEFGGMQVRARPSFSVATRVGETRLFSCSARAISTFSYFRVIWEWNPECSDPSTQGTGFRNVGMLFVSWVYIMPFEIAQFQEQRMRVLSHLLLPKGILSFNDDAVSWHMEKLDLHHCLFLQVVMLNKQKMREKSLWM